MSPFAYTVESVERDPKGDYSICWTLFMPVGVVPGGPTIALRSAF